MCCQLLFFCLFSLLFHVLYIFFYSLSTASSSSSSSFVGGRSLRIIMQMRAPRSRGPLCENVVLQYDSYLTWPPTILISRMVTNK